MRRKQERIDHARKKRRARLVEVPAAAYSISEFCAAHRISEMTYHRLRRQGKGPRTMKVLKRTLISFEAAADWRREGESGG